MYVLSDGKVIAGRWSREVSLYPFEFVDLDGNPIEVNVGNTWIELTRVLPTDDPANPLVPAEVIPAS